MTLARRLQFARKIPQSPSYAEVTTGRTTELTWAGWPWVIHADNGGNTSVTTLAERTVAPPDQFRFTLGTDQPHTYTPTLTERVELEGRAILQQYTTYTWQTKLRLTGASPIDYEGTPGNIWQGWMVLMQAHQTPDGSEYNGSPPLGILLRSDDMLVVTTRSTPDNPTTSSTSLNATDRVVTPFVKGVWHDISVTMKFDKGEGAGYLKFVFDGTVHFEGVIAFGFNDTLGPYLKHGLYRNQSPGQTVIEFTASSIVQLP